MRARFNMLCTQALQQGIITGIYNVGCLVGSLVAFFASERLGRKKSIVRASTSETQLCQLY